MTAISAQAPGKVMLFGEYAVLEGGPAVLMAVDRQAQAILCARPDYQVTAPGYLAMPIPFDVQCENGQGRIIWRSPEHQSRLALVTAVCEKLGTPAYPLHLKLDTQRFFDGQNKLGLGSSSALAVALAGVWARHLNVEISLADCQALHRHFQGSGSGADVAACYLGGVVGFYIDQPPRQAAIPEDAHLAFVWTGISASTGTMLETLRQYRISHNQDYEQLLCRLGNQAEAVLAESAHLDAWFVALKAFVGHLADFAKATGLPVFCSPHKELAELADGRQLLYKPVGAGGGDLGLAVAKTQVALSTFCAQVVEMGLKVLPLETASSGLQITDLEEQSG